MDWSEMPDGVLDGMDWLLSNLCLAFMLEEWQEAEVVAPCAIASLRDQLEELRMEQEELGNSCPDVAVEVERANEQLWFCLDGLDEWLASPSSEGLVAIEAGLREAEEWLEQAGSLAQDVEDTVGLEFVMC